MIDQEVLDEFATLRAALLAHAELLADTGVHGLRHCDEATLEARRARYRELAREAPAPSTHLVEESSGSGFSAPDPRRTVEESLGSQVRTPAHSSRIDEPPDPHLPPTTPSRSVEAPRAVPSPAAIDPTVVTPAPLAPAGLGIPANPLAVSAAVTAKPSLPVVQSANVAPDLEALAREVAACQRCELHRARTQTVFARGNGSSGLCFIGEGPGADEDAQGFPFVGAAGKLLDKMIVAMGFTRDEVYVCNIVKCRPPKNRKPEREEMQACSGYLRRQLELINPRVIVALGGTAVEGLLGLSGILRLRGQWRLYRGEIPVMPTFHPAYLLRQPEAKREVWADLKLVLEHMGRPLPSR